MQLYPIWTITVPHCTRPCSTLLIEFWALAFGNNPTAPQPPGATQTADGLYVVAASNMPPTVRCNREHARPCSSLLNGYISILALDQVDHPVMVHLVGYQPTITVLTLHCIPFLLLRSP
jgi:hypothetical protein